MPARTYWPGTAGRPRRRGSILPLSGFLLIIVASFLAFTVDMGRMQTQRNEMKTLADAAALAAVAQLMIDTATVKSTAVSYGQANKVLKKTITLDNSDIVCGVWNDASATFTPSAGCSSVANAVEITARDSVNYLFPSLMGMPKRVFTRTSRAWLAYIGGSSCVKPWSMRYVTLTKTLQPNNPDTLRQLTNLDFQILASAPRSARRFKLKIGSGGNTDPGNYGALAIPIVGGGSSGGSVYRQNIGLCNTTTMTIGSTINTETGNMAGPTGQGVANLCKPLTAGGECRNTDGSMGLRVVVPLWSTNTVIVNGNTAITISALATFQLDSLTADSEIIGSFIARRVGGTIGSTGATTLRRPVLVR